MFINLVNIILVGASGVFEFSIFGANHTRFALFMILIFTITETVVMYFFITTHKQHINLNILIISQYFWPENFRINQLSTALLKKGNRVTVLTGLPN